MLYKDLPESCKNNEQLKRIAINSYPPVLKYIKNKSYDLCMNSVKLNGLTLEHVPLHFMTNELISEAIKQNPRAFIFDPNYDFPVGYFPEYTGIVTLYKPTVCEGDNTYIYLKYKEPINFIVNLSILSKELPEFFVELCIDNNIYAYYPNFPEEEQYNYSTNHFYNFSTGLYSVFSSRHFSISELSFKRFAGIRLVFKNTKINNKIVRLTFTRLNLLMCDFRRCADGQINYDYNVFRFLT
jgi:hypothetical protein